MVYRAMDLDTLEFFAVKEELVEQGVPTAKLDTELDLCRSLRHPNVISYLGHEFTGQNLRIFLEFADGGSIASMLSEFGPLSGPALVKATSGILEGLDYLHTRPIPVVHRDMKGANVLVTKPFQVKLADFGNSKCDVMTKSFKLIGSVPWMAPEVINEKDGHGRKADIWSFGCTVIEMATAEQPWGKKAFNSLMYAMNYIANSEATPPIPQDAPDGLQRIMRICTRRPQDQRPTTTEILTQELVSVERRLPLRPRLGRPLEVMCEMER